MESKNLLKGFDKFGKGSDLDIKTERVDEKIDVEIREMVRIRPQDFSALKNSFEDWAKTWE
jgi:hypothetical protein